MGNRRDSQNGTLHRASPSFALRLQKGRSDTHETHHRPVAPFWSEETRVHHRSSERAQKETLRHPHPRPAEAWVLLRPTGTHDQPRAGEKCYLDWPESQSAREEPSPCANRAIL